MFFAVLFFLHTNYMYYIHLYRCLELQSINFQIFFQALRETSHKNYGHDTAGRAAHVWRRSSPERARTFHGKRLVKGSSMRSKGGDFPFAKQVGMLTRWWFQICFIFTPILGEWSNLTSIFCRWVESNHQPDVISSSGEDPTLQNYT